MKMLADSISHIPWLPSSIATQAINDVAIDVVSDVAEIYLPCYDMPASFLYNVVVPWNMTRKTYLHIYKYSTCFPGDKNFDSLVPAADKG